MDRKGDTSSKDPMRSMGKRKVDLPYKQGGKKKGGPPSPEGRQRSEKTVRPGRGYTRSGSKDGGRTAEKRKKEKEGGALWSVARYQGGGRSGPIPKEGKPLTAREKEEKFSSPAKPPGRRGTEDKRRAGGEGRKKER